MILKACKIFCSISFIVVVKIRLSKPTVLILLKAIITFVKEDLINSWSFNESCLEEDLVYRFYKSFNKRVSARTLRYISNKTSNKILMKLHIKWYWTKTKFYNFLQFLNVTIFLFHFQSYHLCDNVITIIKLIISMEYIGNKDRLRYQGESLDYLKNNLNRKNIFVSKYEASYNNTFVSK